MLGGFANTAGGVLAAYVAFLHDVSGIAGHLVTSSILSAPATLVIAKVMVPERQTPVTAHSLGLNDERPDGNVMAAAARGASEGMQLAINVAAMLIGFVALMAMADWALGLITVFDAPLSLSRALGWLFTPLAFVMGVPWAEAGVVGRLLGEKLVLTEFIAYVDLGAIQASAAPLTERSAIIASYALCGFANFASIGIQIGGIGPMAPGRQDEIAALSLRAMLGGSLATFMTACVAGMMTA
jgi:concentrative nucleoside transporter, CNT family